MTQISKVTTPSRGIDFIHPLKDARDKLMKYGLPGFCIAFFLCVLSLIPGDFGKNVLEVLNKFTEHAVPSRTPFIPAIFFLGLSMAFAPAELAMLFRRRIALPVTELAAHSMGVAIGVLVALLLSAAFIPDVRPAAGNLVAALFTALAVYAELSMVVFYTEGHLDSVFEDNKIAQRVIAAVGLFIAFTAAVALVSDLSAVKRSPQVQCAPQTTQAPKV